MKNLIIASTLALIASRAMAVTEIWQGQGKLLTVEHQPLENYLLELQIEELSKSEDKITIEVRDKAGRLIKADSCIRQKKPEHVWRQRCDGGSSRGYMVENGYGLGVDYYEAAGGKSYATTLIVDSETQMRFFRTELVNGQATRFFVESLTKKK